MPGCVFRASGDEFKPHEFLASSLFNACNVFRKGEPRGKTSIWNSSGFTVEVSAASGNELRKQVQDAVEFLVTNREEIVRLKDCTGLSDIRLDFGINRKNGFLQCSYLPPQLLELAGALKVGIELSIYGEDEF
jgi:Domain of unknown function (DUF4279)